MRYMSHLTAIACFAMLALVAFAPSQSFATNTVVPTYNSPGTVVTTGNASVCTNFSQTIQSVFNNANPTPGQKGLLSGIHEFIAGVVNTATHDLFVSFTSNSSYQNAVYAAITLMITFYAVGFTIGIVQPSFQQALIRLIKIGLIMTLVSSSGWAFFNSYVVEFFQNGTDQIIKDVQSIATGIQPPADATPFYALDRIAEFVIQPDTVIAIMGAMATSGPFSYTMAGLMLICMANFIGMLLQALKVYAIAFVARSLVLGVAPIFFVFLLFDRTKNLFISWLNALVNLSLRPILLFTFMSFFILMIESAAKDMLNAELCWTEFKNISGSTNKLSFWRFVNPVTQQTETGERNYQGSLECLISPTQIAGGCKPFPIDIVSLLTFMILVYICKRFTDVVERISSELSNAFVSLDTSSKLEQFMGNQRGGGSGPMNIPTGGQPRKGKK